MLRGAFSAPGVLERGHIGFTLRMVIVALVVKSLHGDQTFCRQVPTGLNGDSDKQLDDVGNYPPNTQVWCFIHDALLHFTKAFLWIMSTIGLDIRMETKVTSFQWHHDLHSVMK